MNDGIANIRDLLDFTVYGHLPKSYMPHHELEAGQTTHPQLFTRCLRLAFQHGMRENRFTRFAFNVLVITSIKWGALWALASPDVLTDHLPRPMS